MYKSRSEALGQQHARLVLAIQIVHAHVAQVVDIRAKLLR
jgi:hypothetical protein